MKQTFVSLFALIFLFGTVNSQVRFSAGLDTNSITIGDHVHLTLSAENTGNAFLYFPTAEELGGRNVEVISQKQDTSLDKDGKILKISQTYTITSFEEGNDTLDSLFLRYQMPGSEIRQLHADPLFMAVSSVEVDTNKAIKDIEDIMKVPITFREILPWILLALGLAALAFGICYLVKRIKNRQPIIPTRKEPEVPAETVALEKLEELRISALWKHGRIKEYHTELTDILRQYLEKQFGIEAAEMTSEQILDAVMEIRDLPSSINDKLRQILQTADMVKFAKSEPLPSEHDLSMSHAVLFVNETAETVRRQRQLAEAQAKARQQNEQEQQETK